MGWRLDDWYGNGQNNRKNTKGGEKLCFLGFHICYRLSETPYQAPGKGVLPKHSGSRFLDSWVIFGLMTTLYRATGAPELNIIRFWGFRWPDRKKTRNLHEVLLPADSAIGIKSQPEPENCLTIGPNVSIDLRNCVPEIGNSKIFALL